MNISGARIATVASALTEWRGQLINIDANNRLLYYRDLKVGTLDLADADAISVSQLRSGQAVRLGRMFPDIQRLREAQRSVKQIANKARAAAEEFGVPIGFLAIGMATWDDSRSPHPPLSVHSETAATQGVYRARTTPAAPVLLQSVEFELRPGTPDGYVLETIGDAFVNPVLLHLLGTLFDVDVDDAGLLEGAVDDDLIFKRLSKACDAVPGFDIADRSLIGTFSYMKQPMVEDLDSDQLEFLAANDLVAAIAGDPETKDAIRSQGGETSVSVPDHFPPKSEFLVLDADASQSYVINAASGGQNLVVQGPPGTGKSQTIANLIADLVAHDKSVLFVAQKRAAITAVLRRLELVGLDGLALDMFEGAGSRRTVVATLGAAIESMAEARTVATESLHTRLQTARDQLVRHTDAVHELRAPWQVSLWDLIAIEVGQPSDAATELRLAPQALKAWTGGMVEELASTAAELSVSGGFDRRLMKRRGWGMDAFSSLEEVERGRQLAENTQTAAIPRLRTAIETITTSVGVKCPVRWDDLHQLSDLISKTCAIWSAAPAILTVDVIDTDLIAAMNATASRAWLTEHSIKLGWAQRRTGRKLAVTLVPAATTRRVRHVALVDAVNIRRLWKSRGASAVPALSAGQDAEVRDSLWRLGAALIQLQEHVQEVDLLTLDLDEAHELLGQLSNDPDRLRIPLIHGLREKLRRAGFGEVLEEMGTQDLSAALAEARVRWVFAVSTSNLIIANDDRLAGVTRAQLERWASEFLVADTEHLKVNAGRVKRSAAERMAAALNLHREQEAEIKRQVRRKRGFMSVRGLFTVAPDVLTAIKPCWAMSPLMVSQMLPNKQLFDVVIFDEASQVMPADAIPAIARGRQIVVAGDRHQLPPTDFFSKLSTGVGADEDDSEEKDDASEITSSVPETRDVESILDTLDVVLAGRSKTLTWHYRSKDEKLIATSNAYVYHNQLITFPGANANDRIKFEYVEPSTGLGKNNKSPSGEVARVVDLAIEHAQNRPQESLGIIAFGSDHARRIEAQLYERLKNEPELQAFFRETGFEPFFIKNIERVQGDEREAIILSIGYGKSSDGKMRYMWGPLLAQGGERRLNVAISRARSRMTLVASFRPEDVDPTANGSQGFQLMHRFLQFMSSDGMTFGDQSGRTVELNPFEVDVLNRLSAAGLVLEPQWGVGNYRIDFAVRDPRAAGRFILAVECDGAMYHSGVVARERDRLRQQHLERLGWRFHRIWSTDWWEDPAPQIDEVLAAYEAAVAAEDVRDSPGTFGSTSAVAETPNISEQDPIDLAPTALRSERPPVPRGLSISEYRLNDLVRIVRWIKSDDVVRTDDQLLEEVMNELWFQRRGTRIVSTIRQAIAKAVG